MIQHSSARGRSSLARTVGRLIVIPFAHKAVFWWLLMPAAVFLGILRRENLLILIKACVEMPLSFILSFWVLRYCAATTDPRAASTNTSGNAVGMSNNDSISKGSQTRHGLRWTGAISAAIGLLVNTITIIVTAKSLGTNGPSILAGWAYVPVSR